MTSKPHHEQVIFESDEFWIRAFARAGFRSAGNPDYSPYWFQRID
jgi:hypothetical protein